MELVVDDAPQVLLSVVTEADDAERAQEANLLMVER
jgi:hypothetical protein